MLSTRGLLIGAYIFLGFCNNFQGTAGRVIAIILWVIIPFVLLFKLEKFYLRKREYLSFLFYSISISILFISILMNIDTFKFELDGPTVEKLTPFLGFFTFPFFFLVSNQNHQKTKKYIYNALILTLIFYSLEMFYRLWIAPDLFMNYFNRQAAKTIGLMSTTNVNGQSLAVIFSLILFVKIPRKKTLLLITTLLLISSMARSAIVAALMSLIIYSFFRLKKGIKITVTGLILSLFIIDPLDFMNDGSLLSKIEFVKSTITIIENSSLKQILFGYGMSYEEIISTLGVQNWSPHLPFLKAYLYFGILGLANYFISIIVLLFLNRTFIFPLITYFIFSLAGAPIFWPGLYSMFLILFLNEKLDDHREKLPFIQNY